MIKPEDIIIRTIPNGSVWFLSNNGVEIIHIPSGIKVQYTEGRSQHYNRFRAFEELEKRLATWDKVLQSDYQLVPKNIDPTYHPEFEKVVSQLRQPPRVLKNQNANEYYQMWWELLLKASKESFDDLARKVK